MNALEIWVIETREKIREGDRGRRKEAKKDVRNDKVCDHSEILLPYKSHL